MKHTWIVFNASSSRMWCLHHADGPNWPGWSSPTAGHGFEIQQDRKDKDLPKSKARAHMLFERTIVFVDGRNMDSNYQNDRQFFGYRSVLLCQDLAWRRALLFLNYTCKATNRQGVISIRAQRDLPRIFPFIIRPKSAIIFHILLQRWQTTR